MQAYVCTEKMEKYLSPDGTQTLTLNYDLFRGCAFICCRNVNVGNITR